jgi:hypothetical protein
MEKYELEKNNCGCGCINDAYGERISGYYALGKSQSLEFRKKCHCGEHT